MKKVIEYFFTIFGYQLVHKDYEKNSPAFLNLLYTITAYEYLFQKYRGHEMIPPNENRATMMTKLLGTHLPEAYFIIEAIAKTNVVLGDVCEFGVAQGKTSALIANEIRKTDKKLHLFDSFKGLPKPTAKDKLKDDIFGLGTIEEYEGKMNCNKQLVVQHLKEIPFNNQRYVIHEGFIEKLIREDNNFPHKVSFAYIDFDFYEPILIALNFLHNVTSQGGIFIIDDYDYFSTGVKSAIDEFISDKNKIEKYYDIEIPEKCFGSFVILYKIK